jgi:hypothetical protein
MERSGQGTEKDAKTVLYLYLEGAHALPLAVFYAENNAQYSTMLWEMLVGFCLSPSNHDSGMLFGALLEAGAQSGVDLAHLVTQIPKGMHIKGLRPMLVAAVADYRFSVKVHETALDAVVDDKISLLAELTHRSSRGVCVIGARSRTELETILKYHPTLKSPMLSDLLDAKEQKQTLKRANRSLNERQNRIRRLKSVPLR